MKQFLYLALFFLLFGCGSTTQAQNYKTHKVKQGETIEKIAKIYSVTPFDIYTLNPDAKNGLKRNDVLIIPKSRIDNTENNTIETREFVGYKEHKVKRKETLYSLSKEYNIEEEDIKKHNTFLYANNLRKGDKLKIPVYKTTKTTVAPKSTTKTYTVLPKEGKWRIAYKYGITVAELEALNPEMNEVLKEGEIINVPNLDKEDEKPVDERYSYYKVLPKEGFYRLKLKLGLEQDELETLNPELKESGLKVGMILKVPYNATQTDGEVDSESFDLTNSIKDHNTKHIAIMLPFKLNLVDTDSVSDTKKLINTNPFLSKSLDFHSGVLVALDSLKKLGVSLKVDVYDTKNQLSEVSHILRTNDFENVNAVIGPFMPNNIDKVASEVKQYNIPVISPITKNVELIENVFQSRPSEDLLKDKIINYIEADATVDKIIIIADRDNTKVSNDIKTKFPAASQVFSRKDKDGNDAYYILDDDIKHLLAPGKNIVFLETNNPGFISTVTSKLNAFSDDKTQIILATTNMNDAFEDDEVSNYHLSHLQFHFPTISKMYNEDDNNSFARVYEKRYGVTPNKMAVRGFDLTMDVVLRLVSSEDLYKSVNDTPLTEYVENKFAYKKKLFGGYYNDTVYLVKYDDLKIVEIKE